MRSEVLKIAAKFPCGRVAPAYTRCAQTRLGDGSAWTTFKGRVTSGGFTFGCWAHSRPRADIGFTRPLRISGRKTYSLLAFLAVSPRQSASREELATLLWANSTDQQARQSLRQALFDLRREIGDFDLIQADVDRVWLRPDGVWVDALELEGLPTCCEIARLKDALELARGAFLEGLHLEEEPAQDWQRQQRLRFEKATTTALGALATQSDQLGDASAALAAAERLLAIDPLERIGSVSRCASMRAIVGKMMPWHNRASSSNDCGRS